MAAKDRQSIVIVGAGQTGTRAALSLRDLGWRERIVLIGDEPYLPYEKPPLSKAMLTSEHGLKPTPIATVEAFAQHEIELMNGTPVVAIDRTTYTVNLANGCVCQYDKLLLATGRSPRLLPEELKAADAHVLRTIGDAERLHRAISAGKHLLVVGGGLIGLEVASAAISKGAAITVIESQERLMQRAVPTAIAAAALSAHSNTGVGFHFQTHITSLQSLNGKLISQLSNGTKISHDEILVAIGASPNVELARAADLETNTGIIVDDTLQTSDPAIFAAGDVAEIRSPGARTGSLVETWRNAEDQGAFVANNLLGAGRSWKSIPWFWSDQLDFSIQGAGESNGYTAIERRYPNGDLVVFTLSDCGRLVGVHGFGTARIGRDVRIGQMHIERGSTFTVALLSDPTISLKLA